MAGNVIGTVSFMHSCNMSLLYLLSGLHTIELCTVCHPIRYTTFTMAF